VLLSGGLDSTTALYIALERGFRPVGLSVDYGQLHAIELDAARRVAKAAGVVEHRIVALDLRSFGGSALTDPDIAVTKGRAPETIGAAIPNTYVPARNTIFLGLALALAEARGAHDIFIGVNHLDSSGYPDCRPAFLAAFETVANLGTRIGAEGQPVRLHAPLIEMTKGQIVRRGLGLGIDFSMTRSCYDPGRDERSCGRCDACQLRLRGFAEAGHVDPAPYDENAPRPDRDRNTRGT